MQLFKLQQHPYLLHDIQVEQASQQVMKNMLFAYCQTVPLEQVQYAHFLDVFQLCIRRSHSFKYKLLAKAGVDAQTLADIQQQLTAYDDLVSHYPTGYERALSWRKGHTSPVSAGAMTALNFHKARIISNPALSSFVSQHFHLLLQLLDEPSQPKAEVWRLYQDSFADGFPEYFNAKTLANMLYVVRPDVFPLINDYVLEQLQQHLGTTVELTPQGYAEAASDLESLLNKITGGDSQHFGSLDRAMTYQIEFPHALELAANQATVSLPPAQEFVPIPDVPLNTIFYGPPGTGKTYHTVTRAMQIVDPEYYSQYQQQTGFAARQRLKKRFDELVDAGRISMTTFHQSFAYEDFVEGIRAEPLWDEDNNNQGLNYEVQDGVFKTLCQAAQSRESLHIEAPIDLEGRRIWKMSLGNTQNSDDDYIFPECLEQNYIVLGWGGSIDFSHAQSSKQIYDAHASLEEWKENKHSAYTVDTFINSMQIGDIVIISDGNKSFRGIAELTGEYEFLNERAVERNCYLQKRAVRWLQSYSISRPVTQLLTKNFSQKTLHTLDASINRDKLNELLQPNKKECQPQCIQPYVLIIDEINRGNVARIFGELITLLEPSKRQGAADQQSLILPYSKQRFSVPANVYVIGTMNTADRSLLQLDIALRRRFEFEEMLPDYTLLAGIEIESINLATLLQVINERIEILLGRDYMIGHSYFLSLDNDSTLLDLATVFRTKIIPLLQEYFFADWEKMRLVLNDPQKDIAHQFIITPQQGNSASILFGEDFDSQLDQRYCIQATAFTEWESFAHIIPESLL